MSIARQDAWTQDEDILLAEVVLRHIRESSTQLKAFEAVGRELSRTSAACGFRWNSYVRKQYKPGIELAKKQRKENKLIPDCEPVLETTSAEPENTPAPYLATTELTLQDIIQYLSNMTKASENDRSEKELLLADYEKISLENERILNENRRLLSKLSSVEDDYRSLLQIMERARKMIVLEDDDKKKQKVKFQMDKNGNLERVNK